MAKTHKSIPQVPEFLLSSQRFGIHLGLGRMESLMRRLGNPQDGLKCIHVAGTNGKGSVTTYIASSLASDGHRTGVYTSPFLERFSERIRFLDGRDSVRRMLSDDSEGEIPEEALFRLSGRVESAVHDMLENGEEHPTEFELVTAVAFLYFSEQKCDYVVLETGLGGRLDSTNIIRNPVCSVITALGFDHTDRLGNTMTEIAREKAGIIKPGSPVFLYSPFDTDLSEGDAEAAAAVMREVCDRNGSMLTVVSSEDVRVMSSSADGQTFVASFFPDELRIRLLGMYQTTNAALAVRALKGIVSEAGIREGLENTVWKGRMEILGKNPLILLDGGHNPQGALSFRSSVDQLFADDFINHPPRLILGVMADKDYAGILAVLFKDLPYRYCEIVCVTPDNPRALTAQALKGFITEHYRGEDLFYKNPADMYNGQDKILTCDNAVQACLEAIALSVSDGAPILCMGSLYLAGEVRSTLLNRL